jgi:hypothetical protein
VIGGSSTLTLLSPSGTAQVIVRTGTQELDLPVYVASNTTFNVSTGATLLIANPLTVVAGYHVVATGGGTVSYESTITLQSGSSLTMNGPSALAAATMAPSSKLTITTHLSGGASLLQISSLSLATTATLDITNNAVIVQGGDLAALTASVATGYNAGGTLWAGTGITSSAAAADSKHLTAVGVLVNNDGKGNPIYGINTAMGLFEGTSPNVGDVLIKYTYYGDTNLDGRVDGSDYTKIDNGFNNHLTGWFNGDFNYDGVVDGSDYTLIDNAFNTQGATLASQIASTTAQIAGGAAVPEPATLGLVVVSTIVLGRRRHRVHSSK